MTKQQAKDLEAPLTGLSTLWFQVSGTLCNLKCSHCFISCGPGVKRHGMMSREDVDRYLEEARSTGIKEIYFTGGEPLLNPEIMGITGDALKEADVTILTNATLITAEAAASFKRLALASDFELTFRVSMESTEEAENDKIRGQGSFLLASKGIKNLIDAGFEPIITATLFENKGPSVECFENWLRGLGSVAPHVKTLPLLHIGRGEKNYRPYNAEESLREVDPQSIKAESLQCSSARMITSEGVFCCPILIDDPSARMGSTIKESLRPVPLTSPACYTCIKEGLSCSNTSSTCSETLRSDVQSFYGEAALKPQPELCCPTAYAGAETGHIPDEVLDVSYGCGSPVTLSGLSRGETMLDLGAGAGIDCFIASKITGPSGRVLGIDMTEEMLEKAEKNKVEVRESLGYSNVEFRKGFLEDIPAEDASVDLVTSNCVINLMADKAPVFREIYRILKSGGRFVISDIISERSVPAAMQEDSELWGECISGALTSEEFITSALEAGFYGIAILSNTFYREAGGIKFYSITYRGHKAIKGEREEKCLYNGHQATYLGPFESVTDDEGHVFPRGLAIEVCTDTAQRLTLTPYKGLFTITAPEEESTGEEKACVPLAPKREGSSGCC
ncbi:MAG: methyltransferase domain-containing protein [Thermodesulfobacteriota bacterium]